MMPASGLLRSTCPWSPARTMCSTLLRQAELSPPAESRSPRTAGSRAWVLATATPFLSTEVMRLRPVPGCRDRWPLWHVGYRWRAGDGRHGSARFRPRRGRASPCDGARLPQLDDRFQPDWDNKTDADFGCGVNSNIAAMVADPEDLVHGREGSVGHPIPAPQRAPSRCIARSHRPEPRRLAGRQHRREASNERPVPGTRGLRDPFTAFVCDDATADMLRPVAVEHGWSPEKVNKGGLRNAVQSLSVSASPNILFVDLSESADP